MLIIGKVGRATFGIEQTPSCAWKLYINGATYGDSGRQPYARYKTAFAALERLATPFAVPIVSSKSLLNHQLLMSK